MYVCLCRAITDKEICDAVDAGAHSIGEIAETLGAGTGCGGCREYTQDLIDRQKAESLTHPA